MCTCSYFFPGDKISIHAATFANANLTDISNTCPPKRCSTPEAKINKELRNLCKKIIK